MNLFLQLKVSDENCSKTKSINLSAFEMQFPSHCYNMQVKIWKDDNQLGCASNLIYGQGKKIDTLPNMASQNLLLC